MNTGDWIAVVALFVTVGGGMGGLIRWVARHAERLHGVEVRVNTLEQRQTDDIQWIRSALLRIEDKLERKVDRS